MENIIYKTVILKLSGEALSDNASKSILNGKKLLEIAYLIKNLRESGVNVGVVIGAGNIFRGRIAEECGVDPIDGDYMGMVGTVINCKALSSVLNSVGVKNVLYGALEVEDVAIKFDAKDANKMIQDGYVCLFSFGLGRPQITTDSCAARRAVEINADAILAGKNGTDGVYDKDPNKFEDAKFLKNLTYSEVLRRNLKVMDANAIEILKNTSIVTRVFSMENIDNFKEVVSGKDIGTTIKE